MRARELLEIVKTASTLAEDYELKEGDKVIFNFEKSDGLRGYALLTWHSENPELETPHQITSL
jgi:hypothetical protein